MPSKQVVTRLAPSPTGRMHAGNIFSALMSWLIAKSQDGRVVLRIEDLDVQRSKRIWRDQVQRDFETLGITWDEGPFFQHGREEAYRTAFEKLEEAGKVYPCFCTRADLHTASAPHRGEKLVYPGTCLKLSDQEARNRAKERDPSWRIAVPDVVYGFDDLVQGHYVQNLAFECGDFVIRRSDGLFAYQLAVVVDDAAQGITCVVRGMDLLISTPQQMFLQDLLGIGHPGYAHVPLIVGEKDRRLSKRDRDAALDELLEHYGTPHAIIGHIAHIVGLVEYDEPLSCEDLLSVFDIRCLRKFPDKTQILWR